MIAQNHSIPLTTAIQASTPGKKSVAESLYHEADDLFFNRPASNRNNSVLKTRVTLKAEKGDAATLHRVVATATDAESGLYVQLFGVLDTSDQPPVAAEGPFLTYGKKFLTEHKSPQLQNTATKLWR